MKLFTDKDTGISVGINYESIDSEEQKKAVEGFVKNLKDNLDDKPMLCETCTELRAKEGKNILCNIQSARLYDVQKCGFYNKQIGERKIPILSKIPRKE